MRRRTASRTQLVLLSAQVVRLGLGLATLGILGRGLDARSFGLVGLLMAGFLIAQEALDLGTTAASVRQAAGQPGSERQTLANLLAWRRGVAAVLVLAWLGTMAVRHALGLEGPPTWLVLAVALGLASLPWTAYQMVLQSHQAYGRAMVLSLCSHAFFTLACAAAVGLPAAAAGPGPAGAAVATVALLVVAREITQALLTRWLGRQVAGLAAGARLPPARVGQLIGASWRLGSAALLYRVSGQSGLLLLWLLAAGPAMGTYAAAQRLLAPALEAAVLFAHPLLAFLARVDATAGTDRRARAEVAAQVEAHAVFMAGLVSLLAVAGALAAPWLNGQVYGLAYAQDGHQAVPVMLWLLPALACAALSQVLITGLMAQGQDRLLLATAGCGLLAQWACAGWRVPALGATGQAQALLAAEGTVLVMLLAAARARRLLAWRPAHLVSFGPALLLALAAGLVDPAASPLAAIGLAGVAVVSGGAWLWRRPAMRACRQQQHAFAAPAQPPEGAPLPAMPARSPS